MKIKRSSWHYRVSNFDRLYERKNDNLCKYFWRLVCKSLSIFILIGVACFGIIGLGFVGYVVATDPIFLILVLWYFSSCLLPLLAIWFIRKKLGKPPEMPHGSIVVEYIKARKEKVCPLIEYID